MHELGVSIASDYDGREPLLVGSLKSCIPFICDLSMDVQIHHSLDFVELAGYGEGDAGIRFLKDLNSEIQGRDVVLVDAVIDTGLTMHYLVRSMALREPASLHIATLFDRCAMSASRSPTSSSSATGSSWTSATATCPTSGSCAPADF